MGRTRTHGSTLTRAVEAQQGSITVETLDLEEAADFLKLHPCTVRQRACAGEIPGYKPGRRWTFIKSELEEYLKSTVPYPERAIRRRRHKEPYRPVTDEELDAALKRIPSSRYTSEKLDALLYPARGRKPPT